MNKPPYPSLLSGIEIAGRHISNRVCLCATVTNFARNNQITDSWRNFLIERARGGVGMLITEIIAVDPEAIAQSSTVTGFDDTNEIAFKKIADDIHEEDAILIGQLWHPGRQQLWHPTKSPIGVSNLPDPYSWTVPHVMQTLEVERVAEAYISAGVRLFNCGFDGIELHGAHGYLIMQFLSPASNTREDIFGGDIHGRTRFVRHIAASIRAACGDSFIIGLKMPADEGVEGGIDPDEAEKITGYLANTGDFDYFAYGQGNFSLSLENHVPDLYFQPGHFIDLPKRMRTVSRGIPVMALGRISTPELAEQVIRDGHGDLIGMSRSLIADAAWVKKAQDGRASEIRPSVFDNFPWGEVHLGKPLSDHNNPYLGQVGEAERLPKPAGNACRVLVVGAGPAGMEAAWVAAARGHGVTIFSSSDALGGGLRLEAELPGRSEMKNIIDYQEEMGRYYGVEFVFNKRASVRDINLFDPDVVILATGSRQRIPTNLAPGKRVLSAREYVEEGRIRTGALAVLIDEDHGAATYGVADSLGENFDRLILVTSRPRIAGGVNYCSAIGVYRRLYSAGVEIRPAQEIVNFTAGNLKLRNVYSRSDCVIENVDLVVYASPRVSQDKLAKELDGIVVHLIGDCRSPRNLLAAIQSGHALAETID